MDHALKGGQDTTANWSALYGAVGAERVNARECQFQFQWQFSANLCINR